MSILAVLRPFQSGSLIKAGESIVAREFEGHNYLGISPLG